MYNIFFPDHTIPLRAMLINSGHEFITHSHYHWDGLKRGNREIYIWQYTLSGRGALRLGKTTYEVLPQQAIFVQVPEDHAYYLPEDSAGWEILFVTFYGREAGRIVSELRKKYGSILQLGPETRSVQCAHSILRRCERQLLNDKYQSSRLAYDFTISLMEDLETADQSDITRKGLFQQVYDFARQHLSESIGVEELARHCGYSRSHFTRIFHEAQKMTPGEFLNDLRLTMALRLLQTERLSIKEIAGRCGFTDPSYFCKVFRQRHGVSPERFRSQK